MGQEHVVRTLGNAIERDRIAHAYMFVGPRGIGKTSIARIFAKALNCENGPTLQPCNTCDNCTEISQGNALDVIEIDGASNNGVEQIRDLRESVQYAAAKCRYKIYIIDEVHMLSTAAFNALLKTLEEPPPHVRFMFATTEVHKVPATILSRCQRFDLRRISIKDIMDRLALIAEAEKVELDEAALLAIARGADGGMRDAQSALDQLIAFQGKKITEEDVLTVFGLVSWSAIETLSNSIIKGDVPPIIQVVDALDKNGKDFLRLILELISHFRNLLVLHHSDEGAILDDVTAAQIETLKQQLSVSEPEQVLRVVQLLTDVETRIRHAISRRTLLELTLIRCARASTTVTLDRLIKDIQALKTSGAGQESVSPPPVERIPNVEPASSRADTEKKSPDEILRDLSEHWHELTERCGKMAPQVPRFLVDAKPERFSEGRLIIGFDPEFAGSCESIKLGRNPSAIMKVFGDFIGEPVRIEFQLLSASDTLPGDNKFVSALDVEPGGTLGERSRQDWLQEPLVRKTLEAFDGVITDIRE